MSTESPLAHIIAKVGDLPAMPETVFEVMEATKDPNVAISDVSALIERDPGLTAKILRVSNSPYYGMRQVVGTLKLALVIIGVREIRNIVLGVSVFDALKDPHTDKLLTGQGLWKHSTKVAGLCKHISGHLELSLQGEDFIAGLLHDIGKLILWRQLRHKYESIYEDGGRHGDTLVKMERERLGFDHGDAGAALGTLWNFPPSLIDAVQNHHRAVCGSSESDVLCALVRISNCAAHERLNGTPIESLASCNDDEAWDRIGVHMRVDSPEDRHTLLTEALRVLDEAGALAI